MASEEESFAVLVHHRGSIKRKTRSGVKFTDKNPLYIVVNRTTSYDDLYDCLTIGSDEDLQVMFLCRRQFPEVRTPELLAKLVDVVSSSGGSNRNTANVATAAGSSLMAAVASSSVPVYEPVAQLVASPSFAVDLNDGVRDEVGSFDVLPNALHGVPPVGVGDGELGDPDEDDVEPETIEDDSGDEVQAAGPALAGGGSSSGTQQYPPYFSSLDLDAMTHEGALGHPVGFGARDAEGNAGLTEFQRKGIWEVKRYNGPHTCLATSISSDHRSLDHSVISAFIMPMVRADASVSIKVLLNATAAHFGFRPTYRRVWMAKQKAVGLIYGDWDESYSEIPRWVLGVQLTMPGTVAVLRTSPVLVGGQVDESQAYFHRLSLRASRHSGIASR
ncbi:uncharacterized protein LOC107644765 [Arachis ipaensis]|uniref:uncharacterized protein LOC107644765 n=1 Tax=Arachis ipaensis TaxID=130454 RepID=UPI0007AF6DCC|nr:uncharacterized protein LOC107644765 [Arachis ipaensis]